MDVDLPEVVAEVREAFERYEKALVSNDVDTLDTLFRQDERTIRYGIAREPLRPQGGRGVPCRALADRPRAHALPHGDHHLRPRLCGRLHALPSRRHGRQKVGRQMQTWVRFPEGWRSLPRTSASSMRPARPDAPERPISPISPSTFGGLHDAYARGLDPVHVVDRVFEAIEKAARSRHLHLARRPQERAQGGAEARPLRSGGQAAVGHPLRRQGQHRRRRTADHGRLPGLRLHAQGERHRGGARARRRRAADRQDQPRPVRHRPRRRAHALSGAEERLRSRRSCRADRARARPSPWRWAWCRSRSAPTRRARAACRRASTTSSASSRRWGRCRPRAWCRPAARSTASRCLPARVDDAWAVYEVIAGKDEDDPFSRPIALGRLGAVPPRLRHRHPAPGRPEVLRRRARRRRPGAPP